MACIHPLDTPSLSFCGPWVPSSYKRRVLSGRLVHSRQYPTPTRSTISHGPSDEPSLSKVRRLSCPRSQICLFLSSPLFSQLKALDHDIRVALATLRRHINPLDSPIYRLPPDLFPEIASHLTKETDLVDATHVSYHLRNTLLSHPSLWSHLKFDRETRAWAFLERSGQTPLHIDIPKNTIRTAGSFIKLCRQSDRIASLNLQHWWVRKKFLSQSLPSLRRLEVFYDYYDHDWNESPDNPWGPVLDPLIEPMSWSLPSLTSLIVDDLGPTLFHTPHLTHFRFFCGEFATTPSILPSFLNNCPFLEHIDISYVGEFLKDEDLVVSLPNLRTYTESAYGNVYPVKLFNMLSLPPFCSVTMRSEESETLAEINDILPNFGNTDYLAEIKRIKFGTTCSHYGEVAEKLELVNAKGTKICFLRCFEEEERRSPVQADKKYTHNVERPNFFRNLDGRSVEILCIDGCSSQGGAAVEFFVEALGLGNVGTLILSHSAVVPCLLALSQEQDASGCGRRSPPIHTLIIRADSDQYGLHRWIWQPLLGVVQKRKVAGFPFKSVSLFLQDDPRCEAVLEELRECVERLEIIQGDGVLDWDVDKYFLDGLDHLRKNRDVRWD